VDVGVSVRWAGRVRCADVMTSVVDVGWWAGQFLTDLLTSVVIGVQWVGHVLIGDVLTVGGVWF
jgi:hypothetical protein